MVARLEHTGATESALVIENVGPSIARNVEVEFEPPLPTHETTPDGQDSLLPFVVNRYAKTILAWPPGQQMRNTFYILSDERDDEDRPMNVDNISRDTCVLFKYEDDAGELYSDRFSLDPTLYEGETWSHRVRRRNGEIVAEYDGAPWLRRP